MARHVCSSCGKTLSRMDFVRRLAHRTEQGYYCRDCFAGMLKDVREGASSSTAELEDDLPLLEALEETLPEENMPEVEHGPVDPGAQTVSAPAPEPSRRPSDSTIRSVQEELGTRKKPLPKKLAPKRDRRGAKPQAERRRDPAAQGGSRSVHYIVAAAVTVVALVVAWLVFRWGR